MKLNRLFKRARGEKGLSLIEILSTMSIFGVVASGVAAGTIAGVKGNTTSRTVAAASTLIHDKVEQFRALDPAANPADFTTGTHWDAGNPMTATGAAGGKFSRYWIVSRDTPRRGLAVVRVVVTWNDGVSRSLQAATYVCITDKCA